MRKPIHELGEMVSVKVAGGKCDRGVSVTNEGHSENILNPSEVFYLLSILTPSIHLYTFSYPPPPTLFS